MSTSSSTHHWRASRIVLLLGSALTTLIVCAMLWVGWFDYRGQIEAERRSEELMARVLEDHATRTIDTASLALASIADRLQALSHRSASDLNSVLRDAQAGLPFMRGFAVVDLHGTLLASTAAADPTGQRIGLDALRPLPPLGKERLVGFMPGRQLSDLDTAQPSHEPAPPGVGVIPLLRTFGLGNEAVLLVGLLNPDAIANQQSMALAGTSLSAWLTDYTGTVLVAADTAGAAPGQSLSDRDIFRTHLASREHFSYVGQGVQPGRQIVAFRASRTRPLVLLVEQPVQAVRSAWWRDVREFGGVFLATVLLLSGMTVVAWRGMRSRERTRVELDHAQAQVALRERELSVTVTSVQELIFRTDASGAITFANTRWLTVGDRSTADATGKRLSAIAVPEYRAAVDALFVRSARQGVRHAQVAFRTPEGAMPRIFDVAVVPLTEEGEVVGFAGSAVDVTERVTAEQRLSTQLALTELMLETSPLPLSLRDAEGRFLSVNQAWEDFMGLRRADVIGRVVLVGAFDENRDIHRAHDRQLLLGGGRVRYEAVLVHADGSRRDTVIQKALVPGQGGPAGVLTVVMDVSEFRTAERATREARDAAEEASRAKSEFIANISHELRTPLQSILGFSELGVVRGSAQPKLAGMFGEIQASGKRMLALVNDLLDVAKIESAVGTMHLERTDIRPLVREVARELDPLLATRSVTLNLDISEAPLVAKIDPLRYQQVVRNVLANAIRFSPARARIDLTAFATSDAKVCLRVRDRGPGIPPEEVELIFDAFTQSSKTKDGSGGTGLGLTISRKILEVLGGRIDAQNAPDGGAIFTIYVPMRVTPETSPVPL